MSKSQSEVYATNAALALALAALQLLQLFAVPLLLACSQWWGLMLLPLAFAGNTFWALIHEAIHRLYSPRKAVNDRWGRFLSVLFGSSYDVLRFGHLMHHRYNRAWESEYYRPGEKSYVRAALEYYAKLCGGIYFISVGVTFLFLLLPLPLVRALFERRIKAVPNLAGIAEITQNYFFGARRYREIRMDGICILLLYGLSAYAYGAYWPWFAFMIAARAFVVSFMDNIYHYATPMDNSVPAKEITMPRLAQALILNGNHHLSHHRQAHLHWGRLAHSTAEAQYRQGFWAAARDQWRGPIAHA